MLSLDMPGTGYAEHWPLVQDTSRLHQAVLGYLAEVAWVDHQRIAMVWFPAWPAMAARLASSSPSSWDRGLHRCRHPIRCSPTRSCLLLPP